MNSHNQYLRHPFREARPAVSGKTGHSLTFTDQCTLMHPIRIDKTRLKRVAW
jgi:hypothetical protein